MHPSSKKRLLALLLLLCAVPILTIAASAAETMSLQAEDASGYAAFSADNMFPGDTVTKEYTVKVSNTGKTTLYFHADIRDGHETLAEVLRLRVDLPDKNQTLYDGLMRDMPAQLEYVLAAKEGKLLYRLTAYLDTSVGNAYQGKQLVADFRWWYTKEATGGGIIIGGGGSGSTGSMTGTPAPLYIKLTAEKLTDGQYARGSEFTFVLTDANGNVVQTVKNKDGNVEFDSLIFDAEGIYIYSMTEKNGGNKNYQYDDTVYTVTITVVKTGSKYFASIVYHKNGELYLALPRFSGKTLAAETTTTTTATTTTTSALPPVTTKKPAVTESTQPAEPDVPDTPDITGTSDTPIGPVEPIETTTSDHTPISPVEATTLPETTAPATTEEPGAEYPDNPKTDDGSRTSCECACPCECMVTFLLLCAYPFRLLLESPELHLCLCPCLILTILAMAVMLSVTTAILRYRWRKWYLQQHKEGK